MKTRAGKIMTVLIVILVAAAGVIGAVFLQQRNKPADSSRLSTLAAAEQTTQAETESGSRAVYSPSGQIIDAAFKALKENGSEELWDFSFADIDFDGTCELILHWKGGSLGNDPASVYQFTADNAFKEIGYLTHLDFKIYENATGLLCLTGYSREDAIEYFGDDFANAQIANEETHKLTLDQTGLKTERLFAKYWIEGGSEPGAADAFFIGDKQVDAKEYADAYNPFLKTLTDKNMALLPVSFGEWSALKNSETQKEQIKRSYEEFSYDKAKPQ